MPELAVIGTCMHVGEQWGI